MAASLVHITPTGKVCTTCKREPGYYELETQGLNCYEKLVMLYFEAKFLEAKRLLKAAQRYEQTHSMEREV